MAANVAAGGGHSGPGGHVVLIAHRIALDPTNVQRTCLAQAAGVARFSWNWALAEWRRQYAAHRADPSLPQPNEAALRRALNRRKRAEFPWMYDVTKCASQEAVIDLGMAFRAFFRKQARYPRFKQRGRARDSFCAANEAGTFRVEGRKIRLPRIGWVRMREELRFRGVAKRVTVSRDGERWYAAVTVEMPDPAPASPPGEAVGVDLGVTTLAVLSTGERIPGPKAYRRRLAALRRSSRAVAQAERLGQPPQGAGPAGPGPGPHGQHPPGCDAPGDDAPGPGLEAHRDRGPQRPRDGREPPPGAVGDGRWLPRISPAACLQGGDGRLNGGPGGPLVPLKQDLFLLRFGCPRTGSFAADLPLRLVRPRDRPRSQRRQESRRIGRKLCGDCLWRNALWRAGHPSAGWTRSRATGSVEAGTGQQRPGLKSGTARSALRRSRQVCVGSGERC